MKIAPDLISSRVIVGAAVNRLSELANQLEAKRAQHIVVLDEVTREFIGLIRFADVARRSDPGNRILADLISTTQPVIIKPGESAVAVATLFEQHHLQEAVVLDQGRRYLGLITADSILGWLISDWRQTQEKLQQGTGDLKALQEELSTAVTARKRFLDSLSIELRGPLTPALLIATESAQNPALPQPVRDDFQAIADCVNHESHLIRDLLLLAAGRQQPVFQLVYTSMAWPAFKRSDIEAILTTSRDKNQQHGITGVLLYKSGSIIQVLEGEEVAVRRLYANIQRDSRHRDVNLIYTQSSQTREFPEWTMGFCCREVEWCDQPPQAFNTVFHRVERLMDRGGRGSAALQTFVDAAR